jgi:hypothetical protein
MKRPIVICLSFIMLFLGSNFLAAQCDDVNPDCLQNAPDSYFCLEAPVMGSFKLSNFIAPAGPLPAGGGYVNVIIKGQLKVDIDYTFDEGSHILLTDNSGIQVTDEMVNGIGPKLTIKGSSFITSCDDYWATISVTDENAELELNNAFVLDGSNGISVINGGRFTAINTIFDNFRDRVITLGGIPADPANPIPQSVSFTFVNNIVSNSDRPLSFFNVNSVSVGEGNTFTCCANNPLPNEDGSEVGIYIINTNVSIANDNTFRGFGTTGILAYNNSGEERFLNVSGAIFENMTAPGISTSITPGTPAGENEPIDPFPPTEGVNLFVRGSSFDDLMRGIEGVVLAGNTYLIKNNSFENSTSTDILLNGSNPHSIKIEENTIDHSFLSGGGISLDFPGWNAGSNLLIKGNNVTTELGIGINLCGFEGGLVSENVVETLGGTGIQGRHTPGLSLAYNDVTINAGDGTTSGAIFLETSEDCKVVCNVTEGNGTGGGITFFENCDNAIFARNTMNNHNRGLSVFAIKLDPLMGPQSYRDNRWYGGTEAEAALDVLIGDVLPAFFEANKFTVQVNTGPLWPDPIIPDPNNNDDWFFQENTPILPKFCPITAEEEEETFQGITPFEWALINGVISVPLGSEGKYRDIQFNLYQKFRQIPALIDLNNQHYYNALHTTAFQQRYDLMEKLALLSELSTSINHGQDYEYLEEQLTLLVLKDDGLHLSERDQALASINQSMGAIEALMAPYRASLANELNNIQSILQYWTVTAPSEIALKEVLAIYFQNYGLPFEAYNTTEQERIRYYASLCALEYGEAVYWANAIAGTMQAYNLISTCLPSGSFQVPNTGVEKEQANVFKAYPSPTSGMINMQYKVENINTLNVYNIFGERVQAYTQMMPILDLSNEVSGLYFIEIVDQNNTRYVQKVFLQ